MNESKGQTIMSEETKLQQIIGEAIGEASMCWDPNPSEVFDGAYASKLVDRTIAAIAAQQTCGCEGLRTCLEKICNLILQYGEKDLCRLSDGEGVVRVLRQFSLSRREESDFPELNLCDDCARAVLEELRERQTPTSAGSEEWDALQEVIDAHRGHYMPHETELARAETAIAALRRVSAPTVEAWRDLELNEPRLEGDRSVRVLGLKHTLQIIWQRRVCVSQSSDKTAESTVGSNTWTSDKELDRDSEFYRRGLEDGRKERQAQTSATVEEIAPLQAENAELRDKLNPQLWTVVDDSSAWTLAEALEMHRRKAEQVLELQAELEQAKGEIQARIELCDSLDKGEAILQARLATAEADRDQWKERAEKAESGVCRGAEYELNFSLAQDEIAELKQHSPRWIPMTERKPTVEDADDEGRVVIRNDRYGSGLRKINDLTENWTHWHPLPKLPPVAEPDQQEHKDDMALYKAQSEFIKIHPTTGHPAEFRLGWHAALAYARKAQT